MSVVTKENIEFDPVPLLDLTAQYLQIQKEVEPIILDICKSQKFILGEEVASFESELAKYCQSRYAVGVSSGTDALLIALMLEGIGQGDEVITTPYTFFATAGCIARVGAQPVFVDIDPKTYNIDPSKIEAAITNKTRAIVPVHLYGQAADMSEISQIAQKYNLVLIEDAAQGIGACENNKKSGSMGDTCCFSFFPSKNLGCFGDGGAVTTNSEERYNKLKSLRMHGETTRYYHKLIGGNFRLDALQAAVLRVKLKYLDSWADARRQNANLYQELFTEAGLVGKEVTLPFVANNKYHVFNQYVIRCSSRDSLRDYLNQVGIGCNIYYPVPLHEQECFSYLKYKTGDFIESEKASKETLAIPIFPELGEARIVNVVEAIKSFYQK